MSYVEEDTYSETVCLVAVTSNIFIYIFTHTHTHSERERERETFFTVETVCVIG
jgi:hypothetical protein